MWSPGGGLPFSAAMPGPLARVAAVLPSSGWSRTIGSLPKLVWSIPAIFWTSHGSR